MGGGQNSGPALGEALSGQVADCLEFLILFVQAKRISRNLPSELYYRIIVFIHK